MANKTNNKSEKKERSALKKSAPLVRKHVFRFNYVEHGVHPPDIRSIQTKQSPSWVSQTLNCNVPYADGTRTLGEWLGGSGGWWERKRRGKGGVGKGRERSGMLEIGEKRGGRRRIGKRGNKGEGGEGGEGRKGAQ